MSTLPEYSFFPWVRQGLGNRITADDFDNTVKLRASLQVTLELTGTGMGANLAQQFPRPIPLVGPGDVVGIEPRAFLRCEPRNWVTNFEPNYVPFVEFYDEDFPWRYTPARADATHRLRPWIALVVLTEQEFRNGVKDDTQPLQFIDVPDPAVFPPARQLWAWSHVHVNRGMADAALRLPRLTAPQAGDPAALQAAVQKLQATLDENADLAYSRLLCPRKLSDNTPYHAFVVPVFETGRLAGLGLDPALAPDATASAWADYAARPAKTSYPYYFRWYFRTGTVGDFEYLVRLLKPRAIDPRVGRRDVDVQDAGANIGGIDNQTLGGVLKLGGALRVPRAALSAADRLEVDRYENWDQPGYPQPFQRRIAALVNLADTYTATTLATAHGGAGLGAAVAAQDDPLITPPLYGRWHGLTSRLLTTRANTAIVPNDNWIHRLNLDPRHRLAAGFGTKVVQTRQEDLMNAAWRQVGDVLEAQKRIRDAQLTMQVAWIWQTRHLARLHGADPEKAFAIMAPVHDRILAGGTTVGHQIRHSVLTSTPLSAPVRRALRPRGRLARQLPLAGPGEPRTLLRRINAKEVSAAPPRTRPAGAITPGDLAGPLRPRVPAVVVRWLRRFRILPLLVFLILLAIALIVWFAAPAARPVASVIAAIAFLLFWWLRRTATAIRHVDIIDDDVASAASVDDLPSSPGFTIATLGNDPAPATGATDSPEATRFKGALRSALTLVGASRAAAAATTPEGLDRPIAFASIATAVLNGINPSFTVPKRTLATITLPSRLEPLVTETFLEPFAYPVFDMPMYKPLIDISTELFLPNLHLIEDNSITLLETNQRFIEAYMVGLNHEFGRELMWREYPTDQRGSYFRQFWDVSAFLDPLPASERDAQREKLRDITPLHLWSRSSALGEHDNRGGARQEEAVLTIRGELLRKYPNAVIYAHRARWQLSNGQIDPTRERELVPLAPAQEDTPPRDVVRTPLYEAKAEPDVYFFGFDLTVDAARGGTGAQPSDDPGWFFVIKERPGEPRFGFDINRSGPLNVWNDLAWNDVLPGGAPGSYVRIENGMPTFSVTAPGPLDQEKLRQHQDDVAVEWNSGMNGADVAYVLYQAPVLIAIHAAEMMRREA